MQQSALVAGVVVAAFAVGVFTGRAMVTPVGPPASAQTAAFGTTPLPVANAPALGLPKGHPSVDTGLPAGTLAEVLQVPNYTYLRITTANGDVWAAVNANLKLAVGQQVALATASKMEGFNSKSLDRTFDEIWFGTLAENSN